MMTKETSPSAYPRFIVTFSTFHLRPLPRHGLLAL